MNIDTCERLLNTRMLNLEQMIGLGERYNYSTIWELIISHITFFDLPAEQVVNIALKIESAALRTRIIEESPQLGNCNLLEIACGQTDEALWKIVIDLVDWSEFNQYKDKLIEFGEHANNVLMWDKILNELSKFCPLDFEERFAIGLQSKSTCIWTPIINFGGLTAPILRLISLKIDELQDYITFAEATDWTDVSMDNYFILLLSKEIASDSVWQKFCEHYDFSGLDSDELFALGKEANYWRVWLKIIKVGSFDRFTLMKINKEANDSDVGEFISKIINWEYLSNDEILAIGEETEDYYIRTQVVNRVNLKSFTFDEVMAIGHKFDYEPMWDKIIVRLSKY